MFSACSGLQLLSAALIGIFAGSALAEAFLLVTWWRSLAPSEFFAWYRANDSRLLGFFRPLTIATMVAALAAAVASVWTGDAGRWAAIGASLLVLACTLMFPVYFEAANAKFSAGSLSAGELEAELARWSSWHNVRTAISLAALGLALVAILPA